MGGYLSAGEQSLSASLQEEYQLESHPYLLHRRTNELCTLHKITTNSPAEASRVTETVEEYGRTRCEAISRLRAHYHLDRTGYCSDQQNFYLIFQGQNNYSLREEVGKRRFYQTAFREGEIQQVVETYLCGLKEYNHRFQRDYERLSLDSLSIDQKTTRITLKDPWLGGAASEKEHADSMAQLLLTYPSPEKLSAAFSSRQEDYNEFQANLFSVAVIALELNRLDFADSIYLRKREVNYEEVRSRVRDFRDEKLRRGLECLLDANPAERKRIFQIWGIENREEHFLTPINTGEREMVGKSNKEGRDLKEISHEGKESGRQPPLDLADTRKKYTASTHTLPTLPLPPPWQPPRQTDSLWVHTHAPTISFNKERPTTDVYRPEPTKISMQYTGLQSHKVDFNEQKPIITIPVINNSSSNRTLPLPRGPLNFRDFLPAEPYDHGKVIYNHPPTPNNDNRIHFEAPYPSFTKPITFNPPPPLPTPTPPPPIYQSLEQSRPAMPISTLPKIQPAPVSPILGSYKQSFTFYDNFSNRVSAENPRAQSQVTHPESPNKTKSDERQKRQTNIDKLAESKQQSSESPIIRPPADRTEVIVSELRSEQQEEKADTPKRPTTKNKYNSTIVEVRDEDSPDHSCKSEQPLEEEYVVEQYQTGSRYEGFKSLGMRNGRGKFYYQDGGYYEGQWRNNKMDGFGRLYYEGGKLAYEGSWSQDEFNGFGKVYNDNPVKLGEPFDYSNFDLLEDYWEYYEGMLMKDTKEGRGKIRLSNGELFEGDFHNDRIQGFGKFHTQGGQVVEGIWRESKLIKIINQ